MRVAGLATPYPAWILETQSMAAAQLPAGRNLPGLIVNEAGRPATGYSASRFLAAASTIWTWSAGLAIHMPACCRVDRPGA